MTRDSHLRSPLSRVRGLGSAKQGTHEWLSTRLTSLALVPLTLWFVTALLTGALTLDAAGVAQWMAQPLNGLLMALMLTVTLHHSRHGIQVILEDYVHGEGMKFLAMTLNTGVHVVAVSMCVFAIIKLHFLNG